MSVAMKPPAMYYPVLFGVASDLCSELESLGVTVESSLTGNLSVKQGGKVLSVIPVKGVVITQAKAGKIGPATKKAVQLQLEEAFKLVNKTPAELIMDIPVSGASFMPKAKKNNPPATGSGEVIPLVEATELYQKVAGTSGGSVYTVVGLFDDLKLAARVTAAGKLSLRAEGNLEKFSLPLKACGFSSGGGYMSVHFAASGTLATKTFGAVSSMLSEPADSFQVGVLSKVSM